MKNLLLPFAALALLASCQPSSNNPTSTETLTQTSEKKEVASANPREHATLALNASKKINSAKTKRSGSLIFQSFLKEFPQASFPLALNDKTIKSINQKHYLSYNYERFVPGMAGERFSREVGKEYFALVRVSETPQYTAVVYAVKNVMMGDNAPIGYMLSTYGNNGKIIDQIVAGGQIDPENPLRKGSIQADLQIEIKDYRQHWEKNPKEEGYYDNKVTGLSLKSTRHYHIAEDGHIEEDSQLLGMK